MSQLQAGVCPRLVGRPYGCVEPSSYSLHCVLAQALCLNCTVRCSVFCICEQETEACLLEELFCKD